MDASTPHRPGSSKIEWTDDTWNPVVGCSWASPGCDNCYAARDAAGRLANHPVYLGLAQRTPDGSAEWTGGVNWRPERLDQPSRWRAPRRIFVGSMTDVFYHRVDPSWVVQIWAQMARASHHTFQVLTKRPNRAASILSKPEFAIAVEAVAGLDPGTMPWPLPNVWVGTSVESSTFAPRAAWLAQIPAAIRFVSFEPLLGPVDDVDLSGVDWVIVGGESGPRARPMNPEWVRSLHHRTLMLERETGHRTAFLFKQWGEWAPEPIPDRYGERVHEFPDHRYMFRIGKQAAGRLLDGRTWDEYPDGAS